jgi:hypothetical protein
MYHLELNFIRQDLLGLFEPVVNQVINLVAQQVAEVKKHGHFVDVSKNPTIRHSKLQFLRFPASDFSWRVRRLTLSLQKTTDMVQEQWQYPTILPRTSVSCFPKEGVFVNC